MSSGRVQMTHHLAGVQTTCHLAGVQMTCHPDRNGSLNSIIL